MYKRYACKASEPRREREREEEGGDRAADAGLTGGANLERHWRRGGGGEERAVDTCEKTVSSFFGFGDGCECSPHIKYVMMEVSQSTRGGNV